MQPFSDVSSPPSPPGRAPLALLVFWGAFYILTASGRIAAGDEETMFRVTEQLAAHGRLDIGRETVSLEPLPGSHDLLPTQANQVTAEFETTSAVPGVAGRLYSKYGIGQSVAAVPLCWLGYVLSWAVPDAGTLYCIRLLASFLTALATALAAWLTADTALALGYRPRTALVLSGVFGLATIAWPFSKTWFSEPAVTALVLLAFDAGIRARLSPGTGQAWLGGTALAAAILFRITSLIWVPGFLLLALWGREQRWRRVVAVAIPAALAIGLTGAYNAVRFGSPLSFGYHEARWNYPFLDGLIGLLARPGKGLFVYNPPLLFGVAGLVLWLADPRRRGEGATVAALAALTLAYFAGYTYWHGGCNWGPRFLLPLVPLLLLPAGALLEAAPSRTLRTVWVGLCLLGVLINLPAVLVDHARHLMSAAERDPEGYYARSVLEPRSSPVLWQWPSALELRHTWGSQRDLLAQGARRFPLDATGVVLREEFLRLNAPDFWQVHWALLGLPLWLPVLVSVFCLMMLIGAGCRLRSLLWRPLLQGPGCTLESDHAAIRADQHESSPATVF
jgi:hypothetical protein